MTPSRHTLSSLRAIVRSIESDALADPQILPFGIDRMDRAIAGGGLRIDALHEVAGEGAGWGDDSAALLFIAGIVARIPGQVLWVLRSRDLFAPGLYQVGLDPARVIYAEARNDTEVLALIEEGLRHRGLGAVVGEAKTVPMALTRRLQLAAEGGGTIALLMRRPARADRDPFAVPSAALTRWRVASAPSAAVPWGGLGRARWHLACTRQRGGDPFDITVEAPDETGRIALPAELVHRPDTADRAPARSAA